MRERRRFTRIPFDKRIVLKNEEGTTTVATIENLCLKGASVVFDDPRFAQQTDLLSFTIELSSDETMMIKGTAAVVWQKEQKAGLYFVSMGIDYFILLRRLVELNYQDADVIEKELEQLIKG